MMYSLKLSRYLLLSVFLLPFYLLIGCGDQGADTGLKNGPDLSEIPKEDGAITREDTSAFFRTIKGFMEEYPTESVGEFYYISFNDEEGKVEFHLLKLYNLPVHRAISDDEEDEDRDGIDTFNAKEVVADSVVTLFGEVVAFAPGDDSLVMSYFSGIEFTPLKEELEIKEKVDPYNPPHRKYLINDDSIERVQPRREGVE